MGCWLTFRGSLTIDPPITEAAIQRFDEFVEKSNYPANPRARYNNCWHIDEEKRLICHACKFFEHEEWLRFLYDKFFEPEGYDVYGTLLYAGEGSQNEWRILRVDNGKFFHPHHIEGIHVNLDFWELGEEYARKEIERRRAEIPVLPSQWMPKQTDHQADPYGGIFDPYDDAEL